MGTDFHCNHKYEPRTNGHFYCVYCGWMLTEPTTTSDNTMNTEHKRPELTTEDKQRIEQEAKVYARDHSEAPDKETPDWIITDFRKGAEYATLYERAHYVELLQQVKALNKENEDLKEDFSMAVEDQLLPLQQQINSLTEQVENQKTIINDMNTQWGSTADCLAKEKIENSRLREREKELVEALKAKYDHLKWLKDVNTTKPETIDQIDFLQSLLSKFDSNKE